MPGYNNWYLAEYSQQHDHNEFEIKFNLTEPAKLMPFQDAADYTAKLIYQQHKNIFVALSGGLDSEFIANVLLRNQIPFTPVIVTFKKTREHFYALHWCDLHGIKPLIVNIEEDNAAFNAFTEKLANQYNMPVVANSITCYIAALVKSRNGMLIHGEPTIQQQTIDFYDEIGELYDVYYTQFITDLTYPSHSIGFFFYTPELVLSTAVYSDSTLDEPRSRTKLYENVAYRPKYYPPPVPLTDSFKKEISFKNNKPINSINCEWYKTDLINTLTKDK
jgi:hypothetical protein